MGFLSDGARNAYRKAGGSAYVPEWYRSAIWAGMVIAVGGMLFAAVLGDSDAPPSTYSQDRMSALPVETPVSESPTFVGETISLSGLDGSSVQISAEAFAAASAAGLALWNGDWDGVPVVGELPNVSATFPKAQLGDARVIAYEAGTLSLLFELDENGSGRMTQEFQVTVVRDGDGWAYPAFGG
jgi:hypothetical protein